MQPKLLSTLLLFLGLLSGCGKNPPPKQQTKEPVKTFEQNVTLQGTVSNDKGLIKFGKVEARSQNGELLSEATLANEARYRLPIAAGTPLPIVLTFDTGESRQDSTKMTSIAVQPTITQYDINPLTTAIARHAKALGGYTIRNLTQAAEERVNVPDANKTSSGFKGDPTTQYGGWH